MKTLIIPMLFLLVIATNLNGQPGSLDSEFGTGGKVTTLPGNYSGGINSIALQPDGKIIAAGFVIIGSEYDYALVRYNSDGSLDNSFGTNGCVIISFVTDTMEILKSVALLPDGKILALGNYGSGSKNHFILFCFNQNGSPDLEFGYNGIASDSGMTYVAVKPLLVQPDGKIVISGVARSEEGYDLFITRYLKNGNLDKSFGNNGIALNDLGTSQESSSALILQPDGKIVSVGYALTDPKHDFALVRYQSDGSLDTTFGDKGIIITPLSSDADQAMAGAIQKNGKIVAAGYLDIEGDKDFALVRYNTDGSLDNGFGINGIVTTSIGTGNNQGTALIVQPDEKILLAGFSSINSQKDFTVARYDTSGNPDQGFGTGGIVTTDITTSQDYAYDIEMQPDGKIIVAGYSNDDADIYFSLVRYLTGLNLGTLDFSIPENEILLYPNPLSGVATLEYNLLFDEQITIHLLDLSGKIIQTFLENTLQPAGVYKQTLSLPGNILPGNYIIAVCSQLSNIYVKVTFCN
ncbi:MAG: T9SS type A sorting domain-containing protein [Bacteroidales bacterium]|nr:T9SS type A sorting domain-containing protein [Bacteroidales bacterium]